MSIKTEAHLKAVSTTIVLGDGDVDLGIFLPTKGYPSVFFKTLAEKHPIGEVLPSTNYDKTQTPVTISFKKVSDINHLIDTLSKLKIWKLEYNKKHNI